MKVTAGDFVTFEQLGIEDEHSTRQGLFLEDGKVLFETGEVVDAGEIYAVVPDKNLYGTTVSFVKNWRMWNLDNSNQF